MLPAAEHWAMKLDLPGHWSRNPGHAFDSWHHVHHKRADGLSVHLESDLVEGDAVFYWEVCSPIVRSAYICQAEST